MITPFDITLFLFVLLAMFLSRQPKKTAIALCAIALVAMIAGDYFLDGRYFYYAAIGIEFWMTAVFCVMMRVVRERSDRLFFGLMGICFAASCFIHTIYLYTDLSHQSYVQWSHAIAMIHVAIMLGCSDGLASFLYHRSFRLSHRRNPG